MSTSYYYFHQPVTSVRVEDGPKHDIVTVFENGANAGNLVVSKGLGRKFMSFFVNEVDDNLAPIRTHWGGEEQGCVVTVQDDQIRPDSYVVDEYGTVFTVKQILQMTGRKA